MFKLTDLTAYDDIVIQCHNNPDADAIASAYALYMYFKWHSKTSRIIYMGFEEVTKCNLRLMIASLGIPLEFIPKGIEITKPELLVTVDCQYGEGNVTAINADIVAVVDHHVLLGEVAFGEVRPQLGACSTLLWDLMRKEGFDFSEHKDVATALYYGLFTDTNCFTEASHPLDMDMRDALSDYCDMDLFDNMRYSNLSFNELEIAGAALLNNDMTEGRRYVLFEAKPCDPNILGFISDLGMQVERVDLCVVFSALKEGVKLSIRSCSREIMASEYAEFLTYGVGQGGGHKDKAGGFIRRAAFDEINIFPIDFIRRRTDEYFDSYDLLKAGEIEIDTAVMKRYVKKRLPRAYAVSTDVFSKNTPVVIRTLEGDSNIKAADDIYLMIGVMGEVYPISAQKFQRSYELSDMSVNIDFEYNPTAKNVITGEVKELTPYVRGCISSDETHIYAKSLSRNTKLFTCWNPGGYMYGKPGDYLTARCDDTADNYIVRSDIFALTYSEVSDWQ